MKSTIKSILTLLTATLFGCSSDSTTESSFELVIESEAYDLPQRTRYYLSNDSLVVYTMAGETSQHDSLIIKSAISNDSLNRIYSLNPKSYSCNEQHGLDDTNVQLIRNDSALSINPGVNHPKELDIAIRIINSKVPESFKLKFEDLQPAIFETDDRKM